MGLPDFLTVEEVAAVLRIGRTAAYELARRYRVTEGLPVIAVGRQLRVPRARLEAWAGGGLSQPDLAAAPLAPVPARPAKAPHIRAVTDGVQSPLPFSS